MRRYLAPLLLAAVVAVRADDSSKVSGLTPAEIAGGWINLFDGETTFGWKVDGAATVKDRMLVLGGGAPTIATTTASFGKYEFRYAYRSSGPAGKIRMGTSNPGPIAGSGGEVRGTYHGPLGRSPEGPIAFDVPAGAKVELTEFKLRPLNLMPIFDGKDLTGWKQYHGDEKRAKSKFTVTPEGWIHVKNGPGDLQTTQQWADFVFQGECISNGRHLNSGVFFRCLPGQYQNGYEFQIQNGYKDNDRTKPEDFGTGAIYRRVKARKVVPNDQEWFTMTLIANGDHISTWVDGYQTVDWTDTRPPAENARNGCKLGAGPISLQGHDPTTDLSFRNLRVAELKKN
jgi:hypothetical protein